MQSLTKVGLGILVHNVTGTGFKASLATPGEVRRIEKEMAQDMVQPAAADNVVDMQRAWRLLSGKRTMGCDKFFSAEDTPFTVLGLLVGSVPVDKLFHTWFECEEFAKKCGARRTKRGQVCLLQSLTSKDGILMMSHR